MTTFRFGLVGGGDVVWAEAQDAVAALAATELLTTAVTPFTGQTTRAIG